MRKILMLTAVALVIAGALFLYFRLATAEPGHEDDEAHLPSPMYSVGTFVTDLKASAGGLPNHIRVEMSLRCRDEETVDRLENSQPVVRSEILAILRSMTAEELQGDAGMKSLRDAVIRRLNELKDGAVTEVYFLDFVIQ